MTAVNTGGGTLWDLARETVLAGLNPVGAASGLAFNSASFASPAFLASSAAASCVAPCCTAAFTSSNGFLPAGLYSTTWPATSVLGATSTASVLCLFLIDSSEYSALRN